MSEAGIHAPVSLPLDPVQERRASFALKCVVLAAMGLVFFSTYGFANWLAGRHASVPSFSFAWEHAIPFWPWTIIPYWSIDLLYAASFFLWKGRDALFDHARRLLTVQCISVVCFIAWPLRFSFDRPPVEGAAGALFTLLAGFDKPFNQAPSLHIGLLVVLWTVYAMRLRGVGRWALHGWFALIGISVLTTYQHHMIDVPTGAAVGCFALFLFPIRRERAARGRDAGGGDARSDDERGDETKGLDTRGVETSSVETRRSETRDSADRARLIQSRRLARRYAAGALIFLLAACLLIPVSPALALLLGWITLALLCVAVVYWRADPGLFQKNARGGLPLPLCALFVPTIIGVFVNSRAWTFRHPEPSPVGQDVLVGRTPTMRDIRRSGATAVVDLTAEMPRWVRPDATLAYACVPQLDLVLPTLAQLQQAVSAIETMRANGHKVLVCCALGYSRSALSVAAWLALHLKLSDAHAAVALVRAARPQVVLSAQSVALLQRHIDWRLSAQAIAGHHE
jgi:hypothetical protein